MSNLLKKTVAVVTAVTVWATAAGPVLALTTEELQAQISALLAQIATLQTQLAEMGGTTTVTGCTITSFDRALKVGMTGDDVKCLQIVLNTDSATQVASSGVGSPGNETSYFGSLTKSAAIKFQEKYADAILSSWGLTSGTGYIGSTTRAKLNELLAAGSGTGDTGDAGDTPVEPVTTGVVTVSAVTVPSTSVAKGAVGVRIAEFNLTSGADATLNTMKFTRSGLGAATDYSNVYIYDGVTRLKPGRTISSEANTVEFTNIGLALTSGSTKTITLKADVYSSAVTADKNTMSIASSSDISITGATIGGSFPLSGGEMQVSSITIGSATISEGGSLSKPTVGQASAKVAKIKITAGSNDITFDNVTLSQNGSISSDHLTNFVLKVGTETLATASALANDKVTLVLDTPYAIEQAQNKTFTLYADIGAAKTTDGIHFYLDESADIAVTDAKYSQGASITNSYASANSYCVGASSGGTCAATGSLQGGAITLSDNGPVAATVARGTNNVELLNFNVVTTRDVTVKDYNIRINDGTNQADGTMSAVADTFVLGTQDTLTMLSTTGFAANDYIIVATTDTSSYDGTTDMIAKVDAVASSTALTITPVAGTDLTAAASSVVSTVVKITSVKLEDVDTGNVLYSSDTNRYLYNGVTEIDISASDDFDLITGTTYNFSIKVNLSTYSAPDMEIVGGFDVDTANDVKDYGVNEYIATTDIVPNTLTGKTMTVGASSLTVARSSTPVSVSKVKGTNGVDVLGVSLTAGSADDVTLTELIVRFNADTSATFGNGTGDTNPNTIVAAVNLYDGSTKVAGPKSIADAATWAADVDGDYYKATFDGLSYEIPAGTTKKLTVKVDISTTAGASYLAATIAPAADVTAENSEGTSLTISASTYGSINEDSGSSTVQDDDTPAVQIHVLTAGTLSAKVEGTPDAAIVVAGTSGVVMSKYKFSSLYEEFIIDKLDVINDASGAFTNVPLTTEDENVVQVCIKADGVLKKCGPLTSGKASFSSLNITVPADGSAYIEVLADLNTISKGATSSETPRLGISTYTTTNNFRAVGTSVLAISDVTFTNESNVNEMTLRKTAPTIAKVSGLSAAMVPGLRNIYGFTVAADAHESVSLKRFSLNITTSDYSNLTAKTFKLYRGTSNISEDVLMYQEGSGNGTMESTTDFLESAAEVLLVVWDGTTEEIIAAGDQKTYYVKATIGGTMSSGDSITAWIADDSTVYNSGTDTTGVAAIGSYHSDSGNLYHAASTAVAADDIRITAVDKYTTADVNAATTVVGHTAATTLITSAYGVDETSTLTLAEDASLDDAIGAATTTISGDTDMTCTPYTGADCTGAVVNGTTEFADVDSICCTGTNRSLKLLSLDITNDTDSSADTGTLTIVITKATDFTSGSVAAAGDSDLGLTVTAGSDHNLIWSDNSSTSHDVTSSADWTNGYLVDDLMTDTHTISY